MAALTLSELHIYPVKSCGGIALQEAELDRFGLGGDRRWLLVDPRGRFVSQREQARLALLRTAWDGALLRLAMAGDECLVRVPGAAATERRVTVWNDAVSALDAGDAAAAWLSACLGMDCRLVYMPDTWRRLVDGIYAREGETVSFADGFPLLLISQASLDDLNARLERPVPMNRFRPNLVVSGCAPFAEDGWQRIRIGALQFEVAKPCSRCVIPSIDQDSAARDPQINRVLASYRRRDGVVYFGQNLLYRQQGRLRVGDSVQILD